MTRLLLGTICALIALSSLSCGGEPEASPSIPGLRLSEQQLLVNLADCTPDEQLLEGRYGHARVWLRGPEGEHCVVEYGYETDLPDNPEWNEQPLLRCAVPREMGTVSLARGGSNGLKIVPIAAYCEGADQPFAP